MAKPFDRLKKLKALERQLGKVLKSCGDEKAIAAIARQYRETIREIEEIEGTADDGDEIAKIMQERGDSGKPGAVRKDRSEVWNH